MLKVLTLIWFVVHLVVDSMLCEEFLYEIIDFLVQDTVGLLADLIIFINYIPVTQCVIVFTVHSASFCKCGSCAICFVVVIIFY
jgi:hypothetical protein